MTGEGAVMIALLLKFRGERKMTKLAHQPKKLLNQKLLIVGACLLVWRIPRLFQRVIPAQPQLAPPVCGFNAGCLVKRNHTKRYTADFLSRALDFVDNEVLTIFYVDILSIHIHCTMKGLPSQAQATAGWRNRFFVLAIQ